MCWKVPTSRSASMGSETTRVMRFHVLDEHRHRKFAVLDRPSLDFVKAGLARAWSACCAV
jgi:hypothetical protein